MKRSLKDGAAAASKVAKAVHETIFRSFVFFILGAHFGSGRLKLFKNLISKHGGTCVESLESPKTLTHIIIEDSIEVTFILVSFSMFYSSLFFTTFNLSILLAQKVS